MLAQVNQAIMESVQTQNNLNAQTLHDLNGCGQWINGYWYQDAWPQNGWPSTQPYYVYQSYPVYVCTDKTKKAIDVLKALEADKAIRLTSVKSFIAMVEKIAGIL